MHTARELLVAVAAGEPVSIELANALADVVLNDPLVRRALLLKELLETRSPFALVRAVELAELLLTDRATDRRSVP